MFYCFLKIYEKFIILKNDQRGVSVIIVLGLVMVLMLMAGSLSAMTTNFIKNTKQVENYNAAYFSAEAGVEQALLEISKYGDGYQTNSEQDVCEGSIDLSADSSDFDHPCDDNNKYRIVDHTDSTSSNSRAFWQIFGRTLPSASTGKHEIPNPYFATNSLSTSDRDGRLETSEWGFLKKKFSFGVSLMRDLHPEESDPVDRYSYISSNPDTKIIFSVQSGDSWQPSRGSADGSRNSSEEDVLIWTLSAIDGRGDEYALQGVVWENDFGNQDCDGDGSNEWCFALNLNRSANDIDEGNINYSSGHVYAGEDINRNISPDVSTNRLNRVSNLNEDFSWNTISDFLIMMKNKNASLNQDDHWRDVRLSVSLINTLSESSGVASDTLRYKVVSDEVLADQYTYIVSEGFAGLVKQTIETRFRRSNALPIFTYAIFQ